jgi:hypothetical protein
MPAEGGPESNILHTAERKLANLSTSGLRDPG